MLFWLSKLNSIEIKLLIEMMFEFNVMHFLRYLLEIIEAWCNAKFFFFFFFFWGGLGVGIEDHLWPCGVVVACLLHTQEVPGSIPGRGSYLRQVSLH